MSNKFNWSKQKVDVLLTLKHSKAYQEKFKEAQGNPRKLEAVWKNLALEVNNELNSKEAKIKYN